MPRSHEASIAGWYAARPLKSSAIAAPVPGRRRLAAGGGGRGGCRRGCGGGRFSGSIGSPAVPPGNRQRRPSFRLRQPAPLLAEAREILAVQEPVIDAEDTTHPAELPEDTTPLAELLADPAVPKDTATRLRNALRPCGDDPTSPTVNRRVSRQRS